MRVPVGRKRQADFHMDGIEGVVDKVWNVRLKNGVEGIGFWVKTEKTEINEDYNVKAIAV